MKKLYLILMFAFPFTVLCQPVCFMKTFGGEENDLVYSVQQTTDNGYILSGQTDSFGGETDLWILKLDQNGETLWNKAYGGD